MFEHPLGLLALLALPAIAYLHLFRRKFQPRTVSALFLWGDEIRTSVAGRRRERLPRSLSLACELLAALGLALALAGPRGCGGRAAEHLVVLLDGSASMGARTARGVTVSEAARALVEQRIAGLPSGSRVTLVVSGPRPGVIAGPGAFPEEALAQLARYTPGALHHDLGPAIALAQEVAGGGRVVCFTDAPAEAEFPSEVEVQALGAPADNVAIVHATRARGQGEDAARDTVEVTLASFAPGAREVHVQALETLRGERAVLEPSTVHLEPGAREVVRFAIAAETGPIEVRIDADALGIDDRAFLAPPPRRRVSLRAELSEEHARALGLASREGNAIDRWLALVDAADEAPSAETAHLLLTDRPGGGPATWSIEFAALGSERKDFIGPFLADKRHPLLAGTTLEGLVWSTDPEVRLAGAPLVSAGNLPILAEDKRDGRRVFALALDPARSSLQHSLDWPILLANAVEMRRAELPGPSTTNLLVGGALVWRAASAEPATLRLIGPAVEREIAERPVTDVSGFDAPGLYALERGGDVVARVGVSFSDAAESDLSSRGSGERPSGIANASARPTTSWLVLVLATVTLLALLADWWVLGDRAPRAGRLRTSGGRA